MTQTFAPIVILAYNRPRHLQQTVQALLQNKEAAESELFVFCDAPRSDADRPMVEATRQAESQITGFKQVHITEREHNIGLAHNVVGGVTQVVNQYGRVIVLEDDLLVSPYFLKFMNDALETYADEPKVGHIQACDFTGDKRLPDTFLIKWTGSWGWATWKRAWQLFNPDGKQLLEQLQERHLCHTFDLNGNYRFTRMLRRQTEGKNDSWAIRWNASLFLADVLSLNVGKSLVTNNGLDGSGTNSVKGDPYHTPLWQQPLPVVKIEPIAENMEVRRILGEYYHRTNGFWAKVKKRLLRMIP